MEKINKLYSKTEKMENRVPVFTLGQTVMTRGISDLAPAQMIDVIKSLSCYAKGYWNNDYSEDSMANDEAVVKGDRLMGTYKLTDNTVIWIITEWDRSVTTILLPEEY